MAWVNMSPSLKQYALDEFWQLPDPPDGNSSQESSISPHHTNIRMTTQSREYRMNCLSIKDRKALKAHSMFRGLSRFDLASGKYFSGLSEYDSSKTV